MELIIHDFELPLLHPFTISRETITVQPSVIVELRDGQISGFGEATTNSYYGATRERLRESLEICRELVENRVWHEPQQLWKMAGERTDDTFALCALDLAAHDLWGKRLGKPVYELWGLTTDNNPPSNYTIGIDKIDVMVSKLQEFGDWPVYKIKLGTEHDLEIVSQLREHTDARFRVDANCAWTPRQTIELSKPLADLGVEFIEQPLPADQIEQMEEVFDLSALPVIADENCLVPADVDACIGRFHGINIKLVKCGGLTPARKMIEKARQSELRVMVGCMTESTVGISAIAQILPMLDYVDMDGAALLASDIASGCEVRQGVCYYPDVAGNGITLHGQV
ncbi:MAG: dipeptide epimerase [Planctomycetaceae bacterium]|nr:dipeptide epimerase [Planctomycetaceae bacterium]|tara:strand:+ start:658 stop:1677 length:1020 start_codon:yes stop_codon:yes gene_type:complete